MKKSLFSDEQIAHALLEFVKETKKKGPNTHLESGLNIGDFKCPGF